MSDVPDVLMKIFNLKRKLFLCPQILTDYLSFPAYSVVILFWAHLAVDAGNCI